MFVSQTSTPQEGMARQRRRGNSRATVRYRCAPATIGRLYVGADQEFQHAWVLNLSRTGIGFFLARPVTVGLPVTIQIRVAETRMVQELAAHVTHCTAQLTGEWLVGCEFTHPIAADVLDRLL
jgi:PilZ domain